MKDLYFHDFKNILTNKNKLQNYCKKELNYLKGITTFSNNWKKIPWLTDEYISSLNYLMTYTSNLSSWELSCTGFKNLKKLNLPPTIHRFEIYNCKFLSNLFDLKKNPS